MTCPFPGCTTHTAGTYCAMHRVWLAYLATPESTDPAISPVRKAA